jgi:hypothetical protein
MMAGHHRRCSVPSRKRIDDIQPVIALALAHLDLIQTALQGIETLIEEDDRSATRGALLLAQDNLEPATTLINAALLLARSQPQ